MNRIDRVRMRAYNDDSLVTTGNAESGEWLIVLACVANKLEEVYWLLGRSDAESDEERPEYVVVGWATFLEFDSVGLIDDA